MSNYQTKIRHRFGHCGNFTLETKTAAAKFQP